MPPRPTLSFFIAYDQADAGLQKKLLNYLKPWEHQGVITIWSDNRIIAGQNIDKETISHLEQADLVLLLLSADYVASHQYEIIVPRALKRQRAGKTHVIPILLRSVDLIGTSLAPLKFLPSNALPVTNWPQRDDAFVDILQGIRTVMTQLSETATETRSRTGTSPVPTDEDEEEKKHA